MNENTPSDPMSIVRPDPIQTEWEHTIHGMLALYAHEHGTRSDAAYRRAYTKADVALARAVRRGMEIGWNEGYAAGRAPDAALRANPYADPQDASRRRRTASGGVG
ncbi:hypothetical protein [Bifidobacterium felsineum]|uniref:hypothetical protein n=1 Tax=Bifidobacterium felsineum TaxID=2045440 RepID=UPI001BDC8FD4|nr:hypothetical protein [Bifidobacterium felsineum]MBT1164835.1 hypothetical protein [Bifidobacterium felsineum]